MNRSKVLIIGGGPAGSSAAYFLAKNGIDTVLLDKDKWPRDKVCGGGLTTACLEFLAQMDLKKEVEAVADFKFSRYVVNSPGGEILRAGVSRRVGNKVLPADFSCVVRRDVFDKLLLDKASKAGARVITETRAKDVALNETLTITTEAGDKFEADILVVADGSGGLVSRKLRKYTYDKTAIAIRGYYSGIKNLGDELEFFLDDEIGFGYGWIFPLANGLANVGIGLGTTYLKKRNKNIHQLMDDMLKKPQLKSRMENAKLEGKLVSFPLRTDYDKHAFRDGRALFVGDAAKLVYPLSGEGIAYALKSGQIAAKTITEVYSQSPADFSRLSLHETECRKTFKDFKMAMRMQDIMGRPKIQEFFFSNTAYDKDLGQKAISLLEHSTRVTIPASLRVLFQTLYVALKRKFKF